MSSNFDLQRIRIGVLGLGYVGLPLAVAFGKRYPTLGFDVDAARIAELREGRDSSLEVEPEELRAAEKLTYTEEANDLADCNLFIVTVPTPINAHKQPDLHFLKSASYTVGVLLKAGDIVIYESLVYPGATEEICIPILERISELAFNWDFYVGYSPERINPGDKEHRLATIKKVTSGSTPRSPTSSVPCTAASSPPAPTRPAVSGWPRRPRLLRIPSATSTSPSSMSSLLSSIAWGSIPRRCWKRRAASGIFCPSDRVWSAATASASIPTISLTRHRPSATSRRSSSPDAVSTTAWVPLSSAGSSSS